LLLVSAALSSGGVRNWGRLHGAFISASDGAIPATFGGLFLWVAFRLLRQVRWHND
jgi:hypothetical protein